MRENDRSRRSSTVAVGVDGSAGSNEALRWAVAEARMRDAPLRAIHAWTYLQPLIPPLVGYSSDAESIDATADDLCQSAKNVLERALGELCGIPGLTIERVLAQGPAAQVLIASVGDDDLLVVGSRGHGGLANLLLGSVSLQCARLAPCPVVIVRRRQRPHTSATHGVDVQQDRPRAESEAE